MWKNDGENRLEKKSWTRRKVGIPSTAVLTGRHSSTEEYLCDGTDAQGPSVI